MQDFDDYFFNMPGRVVEFFPETQTATIRICVERIYSTADEAGAQKVRGLLEGVPVHVLSGGGWSLTMPIAVGDTCIIFFSQVGYDHWLFNDADDAGTHGGQPMYWTSRRFDIQDGYALVGLNTIPRAIQNYSVENAQWRNTDSTQVISLNADGSIVISSDTKVIVNTVNAEVNAQEGIKLLSGGNIDISAVGAVNILGASVNIAP